MPATQNPPADAAGIESAALKRISLEQAADRQAAFTLAERQYQIASMKRNNAVLALLQHGYQQQDIADALGITRGRVAQIARRARRTDTEEVS